jgi:hypothetical protein
MVDADGKLNWFMLYREAILEPDRTKSRTRVVRAQAAIGQRARELWYAGASPTSERRQMDAASQLLAILRTVREEQRVVGR